MKSNLKDSPNPNPSGTSDDLSPAGILSSLHTQWLGRNYVFFHRITSTNDHAWAMAQDGAPHGTIVLAEDQTKGRGRMHRPWLSKTNKGITFTMILNTRLPVRQATLCTMVAALALTKVLNRCYGLEAQIKWPNDVLVAGKKVCGILTEMQSETDWSRFIIIGMGINANHTSEDLAGPFRYPATSLALELGSPIGRRKLFTETLKEFETSFDRFTAEGFPAILKDYEAASAIVNKKVVIHCGSQQKHGRAVGFTPDGGLRLLITDEIEEWVWVGDVTLVEGAV